MLKGIHHINIVVTDLKKAAAFFELFGFAIINEKELEGKWLDAVTALKDIKASYIALEHKNSPLKIELLKYHNPTGSSDPQISTSNQIGIRHIALEVDDIKKETERLSKSGIKFYSKIVTNPYGKKMCYFTGPDGILMEILEL